YNLEPSLALKRAFLSDPGATPLLATAPLRDFLRQVLEVLNGADNRPSTTRRAHPERTLSEAEGEVEGERAAPLRVQTMLYIFLDQFEEFFTQLEETGRAEFIRELAECLDDESLHV